MRSLWISVSTILLFSASTAVWATTYYVDSNSPCRSGCDGRSPAKAWNSPKLAEKASLATGSDVCLMSGSVFQDTQFYIKWGGTAAKRATVATCYQDAGRAYWWWEGPRARRTEKAELNGTFDDRCIGVGYYSCRPDSGYRVPGLVTQGLIQLTTSYVTLRAIKLHDSAGRGVYMLGKAPTANHLIELEMENMYDSLFFHTGGAPSTRHIVRNNTFRNSGYRYSHAWKKPSGALGGSCFQLSRGTRADKNRPSNNIYEGNVLGNCSGEVAFGDSSHDIIRGNIFYNTRNTGIYLDNQAHSVVEWNITYLAKDECDVYAGNGPCKKSDGRSAQGGARFQIEDYPGGCSSVGACWDTRDSEDNVVRNNLYVWGEEGWGVGMERIANQANRQFIGKYYLHNTTYMATLMAWKDGVNASMQLQPGMEVKNNVFVAAPTASKAKCRGGKDRPDYRANAWSDPLSQVDPDCKASGDEYGVKVNFRSPDSAGPPTVANQPSLDDYEIRAGGAGYRSAENLTSEVIPEIAANCSDFPQLGDLDPRYGPVVTWKPSCSNWRKKAYYDQNGQFRGAISNKGF